MARPIIPLTNAKSHLRVEHDLDDALIEEFVEASIDRALAEVGLAGVLTVDHVTETTLAEFGFLYPVEEITGVFKKDSTGTWQALPVEDWTLSGSIDTRHVITLSEEAGHVSGSCYKVTWKAGLNPMPAWFRVACYFLIGHYYENRSSVLIGQGVSAIEVPMGFVHLCNPHKRWFFA